MSDKISTLSIASFLCMAAFVSNSHAGLKLGLQRSEGRTAHSTAFKHNTIATLDMNGAPLLMIRESLLFHLSDDVLILFLSLWLDVPSLATLDVSVSNHRLRPSWLMVLRRLRSKALDEWSHSLSSLMWLSNRGICASRVETGTVGSPIQGCDILRVETRALVHLGLKGCSNIMDESLTRVVSRCLELRSIDLGGCGQVTDAGISALAAGCGQLQSINLLFCGQVTDVGISALAAGCSKLQSITFHCCHKVTDAGVSALGAGCGHLQSIDLGGCEQVTDAGVSALAAGCSQLQSINLTHCDQVTDAGVSALGAGCGQLQSIDLSSCYEVTGKGLSALGAGCSQLQSIDLECCGQVTDAGISALGAGCSKLHSIDFAGCDKVTMRVYQHCVQDVAICRASILQAVTR